MKEYLLEEIPQKLLDILQEYGTLDFSLYGKPSNEIGEEFLKAVSRKVNYLGDGNVYVIRLIYDDNILKIILVYSYNTKETSE